MKNFPFALVALALSWSVAAPAQVYHPNKGTEFWAAFLENPGSPGFDTCMNRIRIYADSATTGKIEAPAIGIEINFSVPAGGSTEVPLLGCMFHYGSGKGVTGLRISAQDSVRAEAVFYEKNACETSALVPVQLLTGHYLVTTFRGAPGQLSQFVVVSTKDSTEIEIITTADVPGVATAGVPFSLMLNDGWVFQVQSEGDLTGSSVVVKNQKPVAVFQGNKRAAVGGCTGAEAHHLYEQTLPPNFLTGGAGRQYFAVPFKGPGDNFLKIMALQDSTRIGLRCDTTGLVLNRGEFLIDTLTSAALISANGQILVSQFNASQACHPGDPGSAVMLQLQAGNFQTRRAVFHTPDAPDPAMGQSYFERFFLNVAVSIGDTADFWLDGVDVGNQFQWSQGDFGIFYAQIEVEPGSHELRSDSTLFQATLYGFGENDGFAHHLGYDWFLPQCGRPNACELNGQTVCVGDTVTFSHCTSVPLKDCFWEFGNGDTTSTPSPQYVFDSVGAYQITYLAVSHNGCKVYSAPLEVTVVGCCDTTLAPDIQADGELCVDSIALLTAVADSIPSAWVWVLPTGDTLPLVNQVGYLFETAGEHEFLLFAEFAADCVLSDTLVLTVEDCGQRANCLKMPNIFTPNQDGVNDAFRPALACEVGDFSMKIFNRWGGLIFETSDSKTGWDGDREASDVYVWMVEYVENEMVRKKMAGEVTLVR